LIQLAERDLRIDPKIASGISIRESISRRSARTPRLKREPSHDITHSIVKQRCTRCSGEDEM